MDETVLIKVQEDGSRVVESSLNKVADSSDRAGASQEALQKILQQVSSVMDRVGASLDRLTATMSSSATAAARVAAAEEAAAKATTEMARVSAAATATTQSKTAAAVEATAANVALAESETANAARIHAMVAASLEQVAAQTAATAAASTGTSALEGQGAATIAATRANAAAAASYAATASAQVGQALAVETLNDALDGGITSIQQWRDIEGRLVEAVGAGTITMGEFHRMTKTLDGALPSLTASIDKEARGVASLIGRYDPLSVKTAQLARDEIALKKARDIGIISASQFEKASAALAAEQAAVAATSEAVTVATGTQTAAVHLNSRATRELGTAMSEVASGNTGRLKQSMASLANQTGLLSKLFSPLGLLFMGVVGVLGLLAVAFYKGWQQASELNRVLIITGNTSGITAGQIDVMAKSMSDANVGAGQLHALFAGLIGTGKSTSDSFESIGEAAKNMLTLTGDSVDKVVSSFSDLYDDPLNWADDMDTKFHFLTISVRDHAQALIDVGDKYGAAEVIAAAFADNTKEKIDALNASMGTLERFMNNWSSGVANIKQLLFSIGAPKTDMAQFQDAKKAFDDWSVSVKRNNVDLKAHQDVLDFGTKLWNKMYEAQQKVINGQDFAKANEQADQQRKATLEAGKGIDSIVDKTQKQINYQTKLNQLTANYKKLYFLDPNNKRLQGINFDTAGNPSGGAYQSKVDELNKQVFGKPKVDHTAERDQKKYVSELRRLQDAIDPAAAAMRKLTDAQDLLSKAVKKGDMTQTEADFALSLYQARLFDTINPLEALNKKTDEQLAALQNTSAAQTAATKAQKDASEMLKAGVVVTDDWLKKQEAKYVAIKKATDQQLLLSRIGKSVLKQQQDMVDTLTVLKDLQEKGPGNGGITQDQAQQYVIKENPDIFQNTSDQLDSQLALYQSYYAQIDALEKAHFLTEKGADQARLNNKNRMQSLELQGTMNMLGGVASLMNTHSKKAFAIGKAAAIAQAVIQTYLAAQAAAASTATIPFVGWAMWPIEMAAAIAAGMANVAAIRSQQMPGYRVGGYTGSYGVNDITGVVHGREYVLDAGTTSRIGVQNLDALRAGRSLADVDTRGSERSNMRETRSSKQFTQNITIVQQGKADRTTPMQNARAIRRESLKELSRS